MNTQKLTIILFTVFIAACTGGSKIKDFNERSVAFGWVDINDIKANKLHAAQLKQYQVAAKKSYWDTAIFKFKDGYLFYHIGLPNGAFKIHNLSGQYCLGLCGTTTYVYNFGSQGDDIGAIIIKQPGVYSLGKYKMAKKKTGFFKQGAFNISIAKNAPTDKEILKFILSKTKEPVVQQRIKAAINAL